MGPHVDVVLLGIGPTRLGKFAPRCPHGFFNLVRKAGQVV